MEKTIAIPGPAFELRLSQWDQRFLPIYSNRLLFFSIQDGTQERIMDELHQALQATANEVPFLAGSVVPYSKTQPWLRDLRPEGAARLEVRDLSDELDLAVLQEQSFPPSLLDASRLCSFSAPAYVQEDPIDVFRTRVTFIRGGMILAFQISHIACDGRGMTEILHILARHLHGAKGAHHLLEDDAAGSSEPYVVDRAKLVSSEGRYASLEKHPCWTTAPPPPRVSPTVQPVCAVFTMSAEAIAALKGLATTLSGPSTLMNGGQDHHLPSQPSLSTHDAISALLWQCLIYARVRSHRLSPSSTVHFTTAIDCRKHLDLPQPYFGNAIDGIKVSLPVSTLAGSNSEADDHSESVTEQTRIAGLQKGARAIRAGINATTADSFREVLGFVERNNAHISTRLGVVEELASSAVMLISGYHFGIYKMDFGSLLGSPVGYRLPAQSIVTGMPFLIARRYDGAVEFAMREPPEVMAMLDEDAWFGKFARRIT